MFWPYQLIAQHGPAALPIFGIDKHKLTTDSFWSASWILVVAFFDKYLRYYVWSLGVLATNLVGFWTQAVSFVPLLYDILYKNNCMNTLYRKLYSSSQL